MEIKIPETDCKISDVRSDCLTLPSAWRSTDCISLYHNSTLLYARSMAICSQRNESFAHSLY